MANGRHRFFYVAMLLKSQFLSNAGYETNFFSYLPSVQVPKKITSPKLLSTSPWHINIHNFVELLLVCLVFTCPDQKSPVLDYRMGASVIPWNEDLSASTLFLLLFRISSNPRCIFFGPKVVTFNVYIYGLDPANWLLDWWNRRTPEIAFKKKRNPSISEFKKNVF